VNGDAAELENQRTVRSAFLSQLIGQVAVFDDGHLAVGQTEVADLFLWAGLDNRLRGHLGIVQDVQADKKRIEDVYQGVIDLKIAQVLHAALLHIRQSAALMEGLEASAVAVGRTCDIGLVGEQNPPIRPKIRQSALLEDEDIFLIQPVVAVRAQNFHCLGIIQTTGHNIPGADGLVPLGDRSNRIAKTLKKRPVLDRTDGKASFWAVESESGSLSPGDDEGADLAG